MRTVAEIDEEIQRLREAKAQMVGTLYPRIIEDQLLDLRAERAIAWRREDDRCNPEHDYHSTPHKGCIMR
jgi:hypothetical protein